MQKYGKTVIAMIAAILVAVYQARSGDGVIEPAEWVQIAIAFTTAIVVYLIPLAPQAKWTKSVAAAILAVLQILVTAILGGLTADELILMFITLVGALGIYVAPAVSEDNTSATVVAVGTGPDR